MIGDPRQDKRVLDPPFGPAYPLGLMTAPSRISWVVYFQNSVDERLTEMIEGYRRLMLDSEFAKGSPKDLGRAIFFGAKGNGDRFFIEIACNSPSL